MAPANQIEWSAAPCGIHPMPPPDMSTRNICSHTQNERVTPKAAAIGGYKGLGFGLSLAAVKVAAIDPLAGALPGALPARLAACALRALLAALPAAALDDRATALAQYCSTQRHRPDLLPRLLRTKRQLRGGGCREEGEVVPGLHRVQDARVAA